MNIANLLRERANEHPSKDAISAPISYRSGVHKYKTLNFHELEVLSNQYANGFIKNGITKGMKVSVFIKPSVDFSVIVFSLFKIGAIPVFIDPGMGRKNLLKSIAHTKPKALVGEPIVHILRKIFKKPFSSIEIFFTRGKISFGKTVKLSNFENESKSFQIADCKKDELAAILFTSGGTGVPKGVEYTHHIFQTQTKILQEIFSLNNTDVDIPGFPLFSLFTIAMGLKSAIPNMNPSRPAKADPKLLIKNISDHGGTFVAGSPAIWEKVANYCIQNNLTLPTVKYLVMFGAPVSIELHEKFQKILPEGNTYAPYGATESLPVSLSNGKELIQTTKIESQKGLGTCIGKPVPGVAVKIIKITDEALKTFSPELEVPPYDIGEIIIKGDVATKSYHLLPEHTKLAKIFDTEGFWHRMGDIGYLDKEGRIWFCGRKSHRLNTDKGLLSSIQCESVFNNHNKVLKSALIGPKINGKTSPSIVIQLKGRKIPGKIEKQALISEFKDIAKSYSHTQEIEKFYFAKSFPVDVRHNIKIDRLKIKKMAEQGNLQ